MVDSQRAGGAEGGTVAHGGGAAVEGRRAVPSVGHGTAQGQRARSRVGEDAEGGRGGRRVALDQPGDRGRAGAGQSDGADVGIRADVEPTRESQAGVVVLQSAVAAGGATKDGREGQRISAIDQAHAAAETEDGTLRLGGDCGAGAEFATVEVEGGRREAESLRLVEDEDTLAEFTRATEQVRGSAGDRRGGGIGRVDDQADVAIRCTGALKHAAEGGVACALDREGAGLSDHFRAVEVARDREAASRSDRVVDRPRVARIALDIAGDRDRIQTSEARLRVAGDLDRAVDGDAGGVGGIDRGVAEDDGSRADRAEGGGVVRAEGAAVDVQVAGEGVAGIGQFPRACVRLGDGQGTAIIREDTGNLVCIGIDAAKRQGLDARASVGKRSEDQRAAAGGFDRAAASGAGEVDRAGGSFTRADIHQGARVGAQAEIESAAAHIRPEVARRRAGGTDRRDDRRAARQEGAAAVGIRPAEDERAVARLVQIAGATDDTTDRSEVGVSVDVVVHLDRAEAARGEVRRDTGACGGGVVADGERRSAGDGGDVSARRDVGIARDHLADQEARSATGRERD